MSEGGGRRLAGAPTTTATATIFTIFVPLPVSYSSPGGGGGTDPKHEERVHSRYDRHRGGNPLQRRAETVGGKEGIVIVEGVHLVPEGGIR